MIAVTADMKIERKRCLAIVRKWSKVGHILLHAGEMKAGELRSVRAVVAAIEREIEATDDDTVSV